MGTGAGVGGGPDRLALRSGGGQQVIDGALGPGGVLGGPAQLALRLLPCRREQPVGLEPGGTYGVLRLGEVGRELLLGIAPELRGLLLCGLAHCLGLDGGRVHQGLGVSRGGGRDRRSVIVGLGPALRRGRAGTLEHSGRRGLCLLNGPLRRRLGASTRLVRRRAERICFHPRLVEHPVAFGLCRSEQQRGLIARVRHDGARLARRVGEAPGREVPVALGIGPHLLGRSLRLVVVPLGHFAKATGLGRRALRLLRGLALELVGDLLGTPQEHGGGALRACRASDCPPDCGQLPLHAPIMSGAAHRATAGALRGPLHANGGPPVS